MRLYCFPHAGAGTSAFASWRSTLDPVAELVSPLLPGRGGRRREPSVTTRDALLAELLPRLETPPTGRYLFYGHSLGGLIAYTLARALAEAGRPGPDLVVIGACPPPTAPVTLADGADLPDPLLLRHLRDLGAVPPDAERGGIWERTALPVLRDDLQLARDLRRSADQPLDVPLLTVSGTDDPLAGPAVMAGWQQWSTVRVVERTLAGGHFFLRQPALPRLLARACRVLPRVYPRATPPRTPTQRPPERVPSRSIQS